VKGGRYSYIGIDPFMTFKSKNKEITISRRNKSSTLHGNPMEELRKLIDAYKTPKIENLPLYQGGAMGYLSYDVVHFIEKLPKTALDDLKLPDSYYIFPRTIFAIDHKKKKLHIIIIAEPNLKSYGDAVKRIKDIVGAIKREKPIKEIIVLGKDEIKASDIKSNLSYEEYTKAFKKAKNYVLAGDSFQIKISQRLETKINSDSFKIYRHLRKINPSPYAAYLNFNGVKLVSCSPEHLLKVDNEIVLTRPIAGTYPRGKNKSEDKKLQKKFFSDEKELAEHTMLIDLERNDLGRVCEYGSIKVDELMTLEKYSHVMHIVSNITGTLRKDKDCFDAIYAAFPGGTITGCPKVRTMEIIDELEPATRGPYTGSIGFITFNKDLDFNIIIRTLIIKGNRGYVQVGGGIVSDSNLKTEYFETLHKGMALLEAVNSVGK
jgi:anthranilate/para-aminobenzoate synthase component I